MHVWNEIARRYDASLKDEDAIDAWWNEGYAALSEEEVLAIFDELLARAVETVNTSETEKLVKIIWTDPGNQGSKPHGGFYYLPLIRQTKTMIFLKNGNHVERWRRKDGTNIDFDEDYFGWEICPEDLRYLMETEQGPIAQE